MHMVLMVSSMTASNNNLLPKNNWTSSDNISLMRRLIIILVIPWVRMGPSMKTPMATTSKFTATCSNSINSSLCSRILILYNSWTWMESYWPVQPSVVNSVVRGNWWGMMRTSPTFLTSSPMISCKYSRSTEKCAKRKANLMRRRLLGKGWGSSK